MVSGSITYATTVIATIAATYQKKPLSLPLLLNQSATYSVVPASSVFNPDNYRLLKRSRLPYRANYLLETQGLTISGPTLSLLIHVYDALLNTQITASGRP